MNNSATAKNLEKLSSGFRINRAGDDAAGLAISEKMRGQIRGLSMAETNVSNGINLIQTAEGGLNETHAILQRMRELSVQASNGTYDDSDRMQITREYEALMYEINRIAESTHYNGIQLLAPKGSYSSASGVMSQSSDGWIVSTSDMSAVANSSVNWSNVGGVDMTAFSQKILDDLAPAALNNILSGLSGLGTLFDNAVGGSNSLTINVSHANLPGSTAGQAHVSVNGATNQIALGIVLDSSFLASVANADGSFKSADAENRFMSLVTHELTHSVMQLTTSFGMVGQSGFPSWFVEGTAQAMGGDIGWMPTTESGVKAALSEISAGSGLGNYAGGYISTLYLASMVGGGTSDAQLKSGLNTILSEIGGGDSLQDVITTHTSFSSLSAFESHVKSGNQAVVDFAMNVLAPATSGSGLGSLVGSGGLSGSSFATTGSHGGAGVSFSDSDTPVVSQVAKAINGGGATQSFPGNAGHPPIISRSRSTDGDFGPIVFQVGANGTNDQRIVLELHQMTTDNLGAQVDIGGGMMAIRSVAGSGVETRENANKSIEVLDGAINMVSSYRAQLGATQNRLEHTLNNLGITKENLTSSESIIRDVDMAKEMMEFTKNNILSQASQSMLAQANQLPQGIFSLLR